MKTALKETINLPRKSVERLFEAINIFESAQDEIEDFLIVNGKSPMNKIRKARKEHLESKTKDFQALVEKYA
jgi:hypothetical protein